MPVPAVGHFSVTPDTCRHWVLHLKEELPEHQTLDDRGHQAFAVYVVLGPCTMCFLADPQALGSMHSSLYTTASELTVCDLPAAFWHQPCCSATDAAWNAQSQHRSGLCCWPLRAGSWSPWSPSLQPPPLPLLRYQSQSPSPC